METIITREVDVHDDPALPDISRIIEIVQRRLTPNQQTLHQPRYRLFCVQLDDMVVGAARIDTHKQYVGTWNLLQMAVRQDKRRQGYGGLLLGHICDVARASNIKSIGVISLPDSVPFYNKHGFFCPRRNRDLNRPHDLIHTIHPRSNTQKSDKIPIWHSRTTKPKTQ